MTAPLKRRNDRVGAIQQRWAGRGRAGLDAGAVKRTLVQSHRNPTGIPSTMAPDPRNSHYDIASPSVLKWG